MGSTVFKIRCFRWVYQNSSFGKWGVSYSKFIVLDGCIKILHLKSGEFAWAWYSKFIVLDGGGGIKILCFRQGVSKFIWKVGSLCGIQNSLF